jgi:hypothetical protein
MSAMKMSWRTEGGRLICRWSEVRERVQYKPRCMQDPSTYVDRKNVQKERGKDRCVSDHTCLTAESFSV